MNSEIREGRKSRIKKRPGYRNLGKQKWRNLQSHHTNGQRGKRGGRGGRRWIFVWRNLGTGGVGYNVQKQLQSFYKVGKRCFGHFCLSLELTELCRAWAQRASHQNKNGAVGGGFTGLVNGRFPARFGVFKKCEFVGVVFEGVSNCQWGGGKRNGFLKRLS